MLLLGAAWAGWTLTPMPIGDYSSDHGWGYGGFAQALRTPPGQDEETLRLGLQLFWSTGDFRDHWLKVDWTTSDTWRVEGVVGRRSWDFQPYFGVGTGPLQAQVPENHYATVLRGERVLLNLRRRLVGPWDLFGTAFLATGRVELYPDSLLQVQGADEGRYTALALGLILDSRDQLPSPSSGHLAELSVRGASPWIGSQWSTVGINLTERSFLSLSDSLVLATRVGLDLRWGETPFFVSHVVGGSQWATLGGPWLLRGYPEGRFRGDGALTLSPELRWLVHTVGVRGHTLGLMPTPFAEVAYVVVWEDPSQEPVGNVGFGARFVWDEELLLRLDFGLGWEDYDDGSREPSLGIWFMFDQPF